MCRSTRRVRRIRTTGGGRRPDDTKVAAERAPTTSSSSRSSAMTISQAIARSPCEAPSGGCEIAVEQPSEPFEQQLCLCGHHGKRSDRHNWIIDPVARREHDRRCEPRDRDRRRQRSQMRNERAALRVDLLAAMRCAAASENGTTPVGSNRRSDTRRAPSTTGGEPPPRR